VVHGSNTFIISQENSTIPVLQCHGKQFYVTVAMKYKPLTFTIQIFNLKAILEVRGQMVAKNISCWFISVMSTMEALLTNAPDNRHLLIMARTMFHTTFQVFVVCSL